jgi:hypothetical protein
VRARAERDSGIPGEPSQERAPAAELVLLANDSIRARRRPAAIVLFWLWELALALALSWPFASTIAAAYSRHPRGDAPLWQPGGLELLDLALHARTAASPLVAHAAIVLLFVWVAGLVPAGALMTSIAYTTRALRPPPLGAALARGLLAFRPMAAVLILATLIQGLTLAAFVGLGLWLGDALVARLGEARAEQLGWLVGAVGLACACGVGVWQDLVRAAVVRFRAPARPAMALASRAFLRAPVGLCWSWAWRAFAAGVPIAFGALVAERLGGRAGLALVALTLVHQVVAGSRVALRASWLARAIRAVDTVDRSL